MYMTPHIQNPLYTPLYLINILECLASKQINKCWLIEDNMLGGEIILRNNNNKDCLVPEWVKKIGLGHVRSERN